MGEQSSNVIEIASILIGGLSLVVAWRSLITDRRSADASENSVRDASASEVRNLELALEKACQEVLAEHQLIEALSARLVNAYRSSFALAGRYGSGILTAKIASINEARYEVPNMREDASKLVEKSSSLRGTSSADLSVKLAALQGNLARLRALRQYFETELSSVEKEMGLLREKAISRSFPTNRS